MPTSNQQSQPQDLTPQRNRRIVSRIIKRAQEREARDRIGEGGAGDGQRSASKPRRVIDTMWKTGKTQPEEEKNGDERVLVQLMTIHGT